jgi:hypothetical protein
LKAVSQFILKVIDDSGNIKQLLRYYQNSFHLRNSITVHNAVLILKAVSQFILKIIDDSGNIKQLLRYYQNSFHLRNSITVHVRNNSCEKFSFTAIVPQLFIQSYCLVFSIAWLKSVDQEVIKFQIFVIISRK